MSIGVTRITFVMAVPDLRRSARWWTEVMGFETWFEVEGWAFLHYGPVYLRLGHCPDALPPAELGDHAFFAYIDLEDVDAYHAQIAPRGAEIMYGPVDQAWGMREMGVRTPDGHRILFATPKPA